MYVIRYSSIALTYEIDSGWNGYKSFQNLLKEISAFVPVAGAFVAFHILEIDIIMLFSHIYRDIREKRDRKIKEEGIAEGKAAERRLWSVFLAAYQGKTESEAETEEITSDEPSSTPPKLPSDDPSE